MRKYLFYNLYLISFLLLNSFLLYFKENPKSFPWPKGSTWFANVHHSEKSPLILLCTYLTSAALEDTKFILKLGFLTCSPWAWKMFYPVIHLHYYFNSGFLSYGHLLRRAPPWSSEGKTALYSHSIFDAALVHILSVVTKRHCKNINSFVYQPLH